MGVADLVGAAVGPARCSRLARHCDGMSSSVLYQRLDELTTAGIVEQDDDGRYELTDVGAKLGKALHPLDRWAKEWAEGLRA